MPWSCPSWIHEPISMDCPKHQSVYTRKQPCETQLHKSNTFPIRSYFASTSTPITCRSRFLIRCRLDLAPSCRSILLKCNHVNISPLLAREMCFLLLLCSAEFETSSWMHNPLDTSRNVTTLQPQSRCSTQHGRMPGPLTGVTFSAAPHWLAVRPSLLARVGMKMQLIFRRGCPLQVLHGIVAFVQVLVVYNAVAYRRWRSKKCCCHQTMHIDCSFHWVWANCSHVVPLICKAPLRYYVSPWCNSTKGTDHPSGHSWSWGRIKHRLPLFTRKCCTHPICKSEFNTFDGGSVVTMLWHHPSVDPSLPCSWMQGLASFPFVYPLYPPLHCFAISETGVSSLQVWIGMGYVLTPACIFQVVQVIVRFVSILVIHLPSLHIARQTIKCYHDDTVDCPPITTQANVPVSWWSKRSSHHNTFWIANSSKRTYLPPSARPLWGLVRQKPKGRWD